MIRNDYYYVYQYCIFRQLVAQLIRALGSEMCRVERYRFESRPTPLLFITTNYYPVLYELAILLFYHISAQVNSLW